jgi:hypothetical protein
MQSLPRDNISSLRSIIVFAPARKLALRSIGTRSERLLRSEVVCRARLPTLSQRPHPRAARLAPSLVIGRSRRRSDAAFARATEAYSGREDFEPSDPLSNIEVAARALRRQATLFPVEFQFATLNFQRCGPRAPENERIEHAMIPAKTGTGPPTSRENAPHAIPGPPVSRQDHHPATPRLLLEPDFANSSRLHSAPFQRQPVNRTTGRRFHSAAFRRPDLPKTGRPGTVRAKAFAKSLQPASRASGPFRNVRPRVAPNVSLASATRAKPPAAASPARHQATARVSPGRQTPEHRGPAPRPRIATEWECFASACHRECFPQPSHNTCLLHLPPHCQGTRQATLSAGPRRQALRPRRGFEDSARREPRCPGGPAK